MLIYNEQTRLGEETPLRLPESNEVAWIRLESPSTDLLREVLEGMFHCHPLLVEDCTKLNQRPKTDLYPSHSFITFFAVGEKFAASEMGIVIGDNYVVTVHNKPMPFLDQIYREFTEIKGRMESADTILYHILDRCVDEYSESVNRFEALVEKYEQNIFRNPYIRVAQDIFKLKRSMHALRRIFAEEKNILHALSHHGVPQVNADKQMYFLDVYDHVTRVIDSLDIFRESVNGLLELQMNMKSDRMNEIIKILTIVSSVFLPLTFIVGLYGMNFRVMPELEWRYGYLFVWVVLIAVSAGLIVLYKRKKWL